jgi:hypothetical protein
MAGDGAASPVQGTASMNVTSPLADIVQNGEAPRQAHVGVAVQEAGNARQA